MANSTKWTSQRRGISGSKSVTIANRSRNKYVLSFSVSAPKIAKEIDNYVEKVFMPVQRRMDAFGAMSSNVNNMYAFQVRRHKGFTKKFIDSGIKLPTFKRMGRIKDPSTLGGRAKVKLTNKVFTMWRVYAKKYILESDRVAMGIIEREIPKRTKKAFDDARTTSRKDLKKAVAKATKSVNDKNRKRAKQGAIASPVRSVQAVKTSILSKEINLNNMTKDIMEKHLLKLYETQWKYYEGEKAHDALQVEIDYVINKMSVGIKEAERSLRSGGYVSEQKDAVSIDTGGAEGRSIEVGDTTFMDQIRSRSESSEDVIKKNDRIKSLDKLTASRDAILRGIQTSRDNLYPLYNKVDDLKRKLYKMKSNFIPGYTKPGGRVFKQQTDLIRKNVLSRFRQVYGNSPRINATMGEAMRKDSERKVQKTSYVWGYGEIDSLDKNTSIYKQFRYSTRYNDASGKEPKGDLVPYKPPGTYKVESWWRFREYTGSKGKKNFREPKERTKRFVATMYGLGGFRPKPIFTPSSGKHFAEDEVIFRNMVKKMVAVSIDSALRSGTNRMLRKKSGY